MEQTLSNPSPVRLVLRVGVTGHREDNLQEMDSALLAERLASVFQLLKATMEEIQHQGAAYYASDRYQIRVISPLADGADRIVAEQAVLNQFELYAPLPFYREEYVRDLEEDKKLMISGESNHQTLFDVSSAVIELDGSRFNKELAYEAAGRMVLRQCDVLIAIWDNQEARGTGGTAQIVNEALRSNIPITCIYSKKDHSVSLLIAGEDGNPQGRSIEELTAILKEKMLPRVKKHDQIAGHFHEHEPDLLDAYFQEKSRSKHAGFVWRFFRKIFGYKALPHQHKSGISTNGGIDSWDDFNQQSRSQLKKVIEHIDERTRPHYLRADRLANYYSELYHSGFITNYILSGLAVLFAYLGFSLHSHRISYLELGVLLFIYLIYRADRKRMWYHRRIDYRLLAEILRQTRFLAAIGRYAPLAPPQPIHSHYGDPSGSWIQWHYSAIIRQLGMVSSRFDPDYLKGVGRLIKKETEEQADYHFHKAHENLTINHRLHKAAIFCFLLAASACLLHVLLEITHPDMEFYRANEGTIAIVLAGFTIVSPAFGAAFAGIKSQGEFERVARHSIAMSEYLKEAAQELDHFLNSSNIHSAELARISDDIAEKMIEEVLDWRIVFHKRPIELA